MSKEKNKPLTISLSFKNDISEIQLYSWIKSHSGYSSFIKDILKEYMKNENKIPKNNEN